MQHLDFGMTRAGTWHIIREAGDSWKPICGSGGKLMQVAIDGNIILNDGEPLCFKCEWTGKLISVNPPTVTKCSLCGYEFGDRSSWYERSSHKHVSIRGTS